MLSKNIIHIDNSYGIYINHFLPAENNFLFNEPDFFNLHSDNVNDIYGQLVRLTDNKVFATIAFYAVEEFCFSSPKRGTFGGLGINNMLDLKIIDQFIAGVIEHIKKSGARQIEIKCAPLSHDINAGSITANIFLRNGFELSAYELNCDMTVDDTPFLSRIEYNNVKRIHKCLASGMQATHIDKSAFLSVYQLIQENRIRRGFPVTMSAKQMEMMVTTFPDNMHFFAVYEDTTYSSMVAGAVCMALTDNILYVFYWGDAAGMEKYSPTAFLASSIYEFCQERGFKIMDVGTSTLEGVPNYGLINFKRNLGFSETLKMSFKWSI